MIKITIKFKDHEVEYYNIPYALAKALKTILDHIVMNTRIVSCETGFNEEE